MVTTKMGPDGRVLVPAEIRRSLDLKPGTRLAVHAEEDRLVLERPEAVVARLQAQFAAVPRDVSMVDELIADRRREAEREAD